MQSLEELRDALRTVVVEGYAYTLDDDQIDARVALINDIICEDLLSLRDVANLLGITLSAANMRAFRGDLPLPITKLGVGKIWTRWDIGAYIAANPKPVRHHGTEREAS
jgi:hypothetical protein